MQVDPHADVFTRHRQTQHRRGGLFESFTTLPAPIRPVCVPPTTRPDRSNHDLTRSRSRCSASIRLSWQSGCSSSVTIGDVASSLEAGAPSASVAVVSGISRHTVGYCTVLEIIQGGATMTESSRTDDLPPL